MSETKTVDIFYFGRTSARNMVMPCYDGRYMIVGEGENPFYIKTVEIPEFITFLQKHYDQYSDSDFVIKHKEQMETMKLNQKLKEFDQD